MRDGTYQRVEVAHERLARGRAHRLGRADDVASERRVAVAEPVVDARQVARRRVEVHVHLLDDHALLALDLLGVEERVQQHVAEHVDRDGHVLLRALDVVAGVLLAGEGVELARRCRRSPRRCARAVGRRSVPLKKRCSAKCEMPPGLVVLVARADGVHDHHAGRLRLGLAGGQQAGAVGEVLEFETRPHGSALRSPAVRVLVCRCTIGYAGRLTTRLASGDRVVLFKEDGSVAVHALKGAKPINYMAGPTSVREEDDVIRVHRPASGRDAHDRGRAGASATSGTRSTDDACSSARARSGSCTSISPARRT